MAKVLIRPEAEEDLFEIWLYLSEVSEETADVLTKTFDEKMSLLAQHPEMGRERKELNVPKMRSFPVGHYVLFYVPIEQGIDVVRILHSRRDILPLFEVSIE